jgi:hypothetical protein
MNSEWSRRLSAGYHAAKGEKRAVRLPSDASFVVRGDEGAAHLHLPLSAVCANMQSNAGAFESWCLALRRWCGATVSLTWDAPGEAANPHYERFLYRLNGFDALFGNDWFALSDPTGALTRSKVELNRGRLWLNVGGKKPKAHKERPADLNAWTEDHWESHLTHSGVDHLERKFGFGSACKDQQFPVGLFSECTPSARSAIFPGAKSAIDIVAVDGQKLWIFELKKSGNVGFGALSELMFYTAVMRDAATGVFCFAEPKRGLSRTSNVTRDKIRQVTEINAVLLTPDLHPLIDDQVLVLLNDACRRRLGGEGPTVEFTSHGFTDAWAAGSAS